MATAKTALNRLRKIALALPDTVEQETWGNPHFRVNGKILKHLEGLIHESYSLIAPKRSLAKLNPEKPSKSRTSKNKK